MLSEASECFIRAQQAELCGADEKIQRHCLSLPTKQAPSAPCSLCCKRKGLAQQLTGPGVGNGIYVASHHPGLPLIPLKAR